MATRTYDYKLEVNSPLPEDFVGERVESSNTTAIGYISYIEGSNVYIRQDESTVDFSTAGGFFTSRSTLTSSAPDYKTTPSFTPQHKTGEATGQTRTIKSVTRNKLLEEANKSQISGKVRAVSIYYPGNWYSDGDEYATTRQAWPHPFPIHIINSGFSEDIVNPQSFPVEYRGITYNPVPMDIDPIQDESDGTIGNFSISIFNADGLVNSIVQNPNLVGYSSAGISSIVDNLFLTNIDPRTVPTNAAYDQRVVDYYGTTNAAVDFYQNDSLGGTWTRQVGDSKHLLGAVVRVTSTFQRFLPYWPEYSTVHNSINNSNTVTVTDATVYRVGDEITSNNHASTANVVSITNNRELNLDGNITASSGDGLFIKNPDADPGACAVESFKITQLQGLTNEVATFQLTSFLEYFTQQLPKEKIYSNKCRFNYKDSRCAYAGPGNFPIKGNDTLRTNPKAITLQGEESDDLSLDQCAKTFDACQKRNNHERFGGFVTAVV